MKRYFLMLYAVFSLGAIYGQVGINTRLPLGIWHIDVNGNTSGLTNLEDDVIIANDGGAGVSVSLGGLPVKSASIALYSQNKGFVPNRVELTSSLDMTTIPSPETGAVVYNTKSAGTYPNNVLPGYYQFNGTKWYRLKISGYLGVSETRFLNTATTTVSTVTGTEYIAPTLDFGTMLIFEDGAYAFSFNVTATSSTGALTDKITRGVSYIYFLIKRADSSDFNTLVSTCEFNPGLFSSGQSFTFSAMQGVELKAGDQIKFTTRHLNGYPSITYKALETFLVYWKL